MKRIPIGQFSKMTRLSVKALRHYDDRGLLAPSYVDSESRYRYYTEDQAKRAELIRTLRSVEMPVEQIRKILETDDPSQIKKELVAHRERLTAQMTGQKRMLAYLDTIIQRKESPMSYNIEVNEVEPQLIAAVRIETTLSKVGADIQAGFGTLMKGLSRAGVAPSGPPFLVYHDVLEESTSGEIQVCVPIESAFNGEEGVSVKTLEGGTMATTVHQGPYEGVGPAYHSLTSWVVESKYETAGPPREIYLNDPRECSQSELLTKIEYPVSISSD